MQRFVAALLTEAGALVEPVEPDGLEVLAAPPLQQALGIGELGRFGFGPALPAGAQRIGIESDWLARFERLLGERGRFTREVLRPVLRKAPDPERLLEQELDLENATYRLLGAAPAWTRHLVPTFRFTALSDEKREGLLGLPINLATGAMPDAMLARLEEREDRFEPDAETPEETVPEDATLPSDWAPEQLAERVRQALPWRVDAALATFVKGLQRRLSRDLDRLHAYHNDLHREAAFRVAQLAAGDAGRQREAQRIAAIAQDYRAKLDDLGRKYALRVTARWVQTLDLVLPVQRLTVQIRRRKAERVMTLDWNPLIRRLEPPPCEATWSTERPRLVCDEALHLVIPAGLAPCPSCGRAYCRACHPQTCPRCGHADGLLAFARSAASTARSANGNAGKER